MMIRSCISVLLLISVFTKCVSQKHTSTLNCKGDILDVGIAIKGFPSCSHCEIKKDSLKDGFSIVLSDPAYKVLAFRIGYYDADHLLFEKDIFGNKINKMNVDFLSKLKPGDFISIECINIEKDKERYLSISMQIVVDE